jgi:hypothetical protein
LGSSKILLDVVREYTYLNTQVQLHRLSAHQLFLNHIMHRDYSSPGSSGFTLTTSCTTATRHLTARALPQPRCAPRLLVSRLQRLYINCVVRHGYSSTGRTSSTSTSSCTAITRLPVTPSLHRLHRVPQVMISRLQRLYFNYAACPGASSPRAARRQLLQLRRAFRCLGSSRSSSSTTSPMPCLSCHT